MREWDERGAEPLRGPVELDRLAARLDHGGDAVAGADPGPGEPAGESPDALQQLRVGQPEVAVDHGFGIGMALGRGEERNREVHPAAFSIASTIGV